jgi:hypothetical protein
MAKSGRCRAAVILGLWDRVEWPQRQSRRCVRTDKSLLTPDRTHPQFIGPPARSLHTTGELYNTPWLQSLSNTDIVSITATRCCLSSTHSFHSQSHNRYTATSKANSPHTAIQRFLFQFPISSRILKVIKWLLTPSSLSSHHFYSFFYLSLNNMF